MTVLVDSTIRSSAVVLVAWLAALALRGAPADLRRRLWLAAICAMAGVPLAQRVMPPVLSSTFTVDTSASLYGLSDAAFADPAPLARWMTIAWLSGMGLALARLAAGLFAIARLTRRVVEHDGALYSNDIGTPMTWGIYRPVVLLPAYTMRWDAHRRSLLMRHEQAHVDCHDWLWQMIAQVVCAAWWFNPLAWLAVRQLRRECEWAADDRVLSAGTDAPAYAAQLLEVARAIQQPVVSSGVGMAGRGSLECRVRAILDPGRRRVSASRVRRAAIVVAVVALGVPLAALQSGRAYRVGDEGLIPPRPLVTTKPAYTREALRARIEGVVVVSAEVSEQGLPENIHVVQSLDDGLDANAVASVAGWRFEPGRKDGTAVRVAVEISVEYTLR